MKEKPPVLSEAQIDQAWPLEAAWQPPFTWQKVLEEVTRCARMVAEAQRDADVAYYEPIIQAEIEGLFETIEAMYPELKQGYWESKNWQSLKSKYVEAK